MSQWSFFNPAGIRSLNSISGLFFDDSINSSTALTSTNLIVIVDYLDRTDKQVQKIKEYRAWRNLPLKIILDYSFESGTTSNAINNRLDSYNTLGIDMSNVLVLLNDSTQDPIDYSNIKCQYELIDLFAISALIRYKTYKHPMSTVSVADRPLLFNLLLGKLAKPLRSDVIYQFYKQGLFNYTKFGMLGTVKELKKSLNIKDDQFFSDVTPYLKPYDNITSFSTSEGRSSDGWSGSSEIYDSTTVSYICETHDNIAQPYSNNNFITEKTYRPIINRHPFVVQSTSGFLENLHNKGFLTFSMFIDESYDTYTSIEPNRVGKLVNTANSLLKVVPKYSSEIQSIVNHNYKCLLRNARGEQRRVGKIIENFLK